MVMHAGIKKLAQRDGFDLTMLDGLYWLGLAEISTKEPHNKKLAKIEREKYAICLYSGLVNRRSVDV